MVIERELIVAGVSMFGSFFTGAIKKHKTPLPNGMIPFTNPIMFGGATAVATGEPASIAASVVGSIAATGLHMLFKKMTGR